MLRHLHQIEQFDGFCGVCSVRVLHDFNGTDFFRLPGGAGFQRNDGVQDAQHRFIGLEGGVVMEFFGYKGSEDGFWRFHLGWVLDGQALPVVK
ncbi:MAG: hypothetical protein IPI11_11930 [Haliscomenobacter sp.]|nr:hypothetical protein [Haliscomenobacter sp.]